MGIYSPLYACATRGDLSASLLHYSRVPGRGETYSKRARTTCLLCALPYRSALVRAGPEDTPPAPCDHLARRWHHGRKRNRGRAARGCRPYTRFEYVTPCHRWFGRVTYANPLSNSPISYFFFPLPASGLYLSFQILLGCGRQSRCHECIGS